MVTSRTWEHQPIRNRTTTERLGAITYRFVFNGVSYTAERFTVDGTSARDAERLVPGQRVTAYVPPEHPERAVLAPGMPLVKVIIGGALALTFLVLSVLYGLTTLAKILGLDSWPFTFKARARGRS
ncbi:DUF3592 domain-containing protein [Pyxidicoccus trucidator]|uniref:DUF3592 domain-containing protein n=1 Tax=Pyxidicoccus trucidator TaxID=2709662 RepID=UPI001F073384